jgi:hypothetical protein
LFVRGQAENKNTDFFPAVNVVQAWRQLEPAVSYGHGEPP